MKRNRNSLKYRVRMWFYRLTKDDFRKFGLELFDGFSLIVAAIVMFFTLFILPAFFH